MSNRIALDGNEAVAKVAYHLNEVVAIYPITPSSPMGEWCDQWSSEGKLNLWGAVPSVTEMQSEGGVAGAVHGAILTGALTTTFTSSQGLLLMIPNMYKIAGELMPCTMHVAARTVATHALSIFGDHSDVMAVRQTGWGMLCSGSIQEAHDFALIAQMAAFESSIPFVHFFDGFRTSHEVNGLIPLQDDDFRALLNEEAIQHHRRRSLTPERPVLRGSAQNPDVFFQAREAINLQYQRVPGLVTAAMERFEHQVGRAYRIFEYHGAADAERIVVLMGSGAEIAHEAVDALNEHGARVGVLKVRLYRPFDQAAFFSALPTSVRAIAVLDRTKEPGALGEPLYQDIVTALAQARRDGTSTLARDPLVIGGRYGLSSKDFTPAMVRAVFQELAAAKPRHSFSVGIRDDVTGMSLDYDPTFSTEPADTVRALFYGLGSDGTVGANKNTIKIISDETELHAQGYFVYDSKKSGAVTVSHLRFGPRPIRASYLIREASFIAVHQWGFLERYDILKDASPGAVLLLNSPYDPEETWARLPHPLQVEIVEKKIRPFAIDGYRVAREAGLGGRINTIMQVCFFALSGVLPREEAIAAIKHATEKTYKAKGKEVLERNFAAIDSALSHMSEVPVHPGKWSAIEFRRTVPQEAPDFVQRVTSLILEGRGDELPVSAFPVDGAFPTATSQWEKRNIAQEIPVWEPGLCIQCAKCALVCPHAAIRVKIYPEPELSHRPESFKATPYKGREYPDHMLTYQVAPEDCTGCTLCVDVCPAQGEVELDGKLQTVKAVHMRSSLPLHDAEVKNFDFFLHLPEMDRRDIKMDTIKGSQLLQPLFEFSGACSGCGETPYLKLLSQLFGNRAMIANATGCSSIFGGNLPTTPWAQDRDGRGPAWANSLFEDNAEFGLGFRLTLDALGHEARTLMMTLSGQLGEELCTAILGPGSTPGSHLAHHHIMAEAHTAGGVVPGHEAWSEAEFSAQRERVGLLREKLSRIDTPEARRLFELTDFLVPRSVWIVGGDGWAYDIGFGGLDHVIASGRNVNILVLDTEVYSNTGGQMSKSTPLGAVARFASGGKHTAKKDLALMAMSYGNIYVARIALGGKDLQTLQAFREADSYDGPSLLIAYSHCIAHGIDMGLGLRDQKAAVESGYWPLFRFDPRKRDLGEHPLKLDSPKPKMPFREFAMMEGRYRSLLQSDPVEAEKLLGQAQEIVDFRWRMYEQLAGLE
ncbi:MAG: pyruvate:ferredoxin (flavodoxin) oxidoreductase [Candidatus Eisenbacteria bacterium]|nr:pyruvate:ferredoxin (flavodoxin) oxidoreductase [Candidatus Eisenbacteria bacterium]